MQPYVLGFAFDYEAGKVALIKKNKPEWQRGLHNGIGGKVEANEAAIDAMVREFHEETGVQTDPFDWRHFGTMGGKDFCVDLFAMRSCLTKKVKSLTDEQVIIVDINPDDQGDSQPAVACAGALTASESGRPQALPVGSNGAGTGGLGGL